MGCSAHSGKAKGMGPKEGAWALKWRHGLGAGLQWFQAWQHGARWPFIAGTVLVFSSSKFLACRRPMRPGTIHQGG